MKEEFVSDAEIREFLLGSADDSERHRVESLFISDHECNQKILIAEDDLIEDYLDNSLAPIDRGKFLAQYGRTPEQQRRLRIAGLIREHVKSEARLTESAPAIEKWRAFVSQFQTRNLKLLIPIAATLIIACIIGIVWLVKSNNQRLVERELAELNSGPNPSEDSSQVVSLVLPPVSVRSVRPETKVTLREGISIVELDLLWTQREQYLSYNVVVRRFGTNEESRISGLHVANRPIKGNLILVRLPTHLLKDGLYQVILTGINPDGALSASEEYSFNVGG